MNFPNKFITATTERCSFEKYVPAPLFRRSFTISKKITSSKLLICGLGFYELYINGIKITKGALAPYISAPDDIIYYDEYDILDYLSVGENVIGVILGNGMQNPFSAGWWDFDKVKWISSPCMALSFNLDDVVIESDESFKCSYSPIFFDELRCGEYYDARNEQIGWSKPNFDDCKWNNAIKAPMPRGQAKLCTAEPIVVTQQLKPITIEEQEGGFLYDFGLNLSGVCCLTISGQKRQQIVLEHGERLVDGKLDLKNISIVREDYLQKDIYICKGDGVESYTPTFTFHGFRYVFVTGINKEQATQELLTYLVMNSNLEELGNFECSDNVANQLQSMTRRSTLSNFYYFPMDCPHREKHGWTADAALSSEHILLNLKAENSFAEWLCNIRAAQNHKGQIPCIVPTGDWGYDWGNGPVFDSVIIWVPYYIYRYRGDIEILKDNATAIFNYLNYLTTIINEDGLVDRGLGDWAQVGTVCWHENSTPLIFAITVISMDMCKKAEYIFGVLGMQPQKEFANNIYNRLYSSARLKLIDKNTLTALGNCQTSQAMAIFYNLFEESEKKQAFDRLVEIIEKDNNSMNVGILGGRVIFHVLSQFGKSDLAFHMITKKEYPSYGNWIMRGATTLWEEFQPEGGSVSSLNHHFWGDISSWFIKNIGGINFNPTGRNLNEVIIAPKFIEKLNFATAFHITPLGKIEVNWKREGDRVLLSINVPEKMTGTVHLEGKYVFENGDSIVDLHNGTYVVNF